MFNVNLSSISAILWHHQFYDWLMFNANFSSISTISWHHRYHDWLKHQSILILVMPRYGWNTANDGVKHQSINQSWYWWRHYMAEKLVKLVLNINQSTNQSCYWWCHGMAEMLLKLTLNIYQSIMILALYIFPWENSYLSSASLKIVLNFNSDSPKNLKKKSRFNQTD
jgi:hypothetical protein